MKFYRLKEASALFLYGFVSILLVFLNKHIFLGPSSYPSFTTWIQQVCGLISYIFVYKLSSIILGGDKLFSKPTIEYKKIKACMCMSGSCTMFILLSNLCLKYIPISSYAISRSSTLLFNVILSILILKQKISWKCMFGCLVVIVGFVIGSFDSSSLNIYGILAGVLSSLFQSIYTIQIKSVTIKMENDEFLIYWYNVLITSVLALIPVFLSGEYIAFIEFYKLDVNGLFNVLGPILLSGVLNFLLGIITNWCIKTTSPIAYSLTGYVKSCLQTVFGILLNNETFYINTIIGLLLTVGGSVIYTFANLVSRKNNDQQNSHKEDVKVYDVVENDDIEINSSEKKIDSYIIQHVPDNLENIKKLINNCRLQVCISNNKNISQNVIVDKNQIKLAVT
ncbi:hypothetical protein FG386_002689 [Cryptosporidium ryanae]|uniref:uncharacterized protein n=1 Tax=Cryptosporidium ryanae TaxID=515981 RepID=UPI003519FECB|nr:hypothetical protein FG386_002689 [Cryptosporidium ryanae]